MHIYYWQLYLDNDGNLSEQLNEDFLKNIYKDYVEQMANNLTYVHKFNEKDNVDFSQFCYDNLNDSDYLFKEQLLTKEFDFYKEIIKIEVAEKQPETVHKNNFLKIGVKGILSEEQMRFGYDPNGHFSRDDKLFYLDSETINNGVSYGSDVVKKGHEPKEKNDYQKITLSLPKKEDKADE